MRVPKTILISRIAGMRSGRKGWGRDSWTNWRAAFDRVVLNPMSHPEVEAGVRRALPHAFPYLVFYSVGDETLHVLAVIHAAQDPAYIAQRLGA
jgi:plasmid stabilization system protein ParE